MQISSLLFPTTIPQKGPLRQLLLFFDEVVSYAPAEDNARQADGLIEGYRFYAPVPFGDDLNKFQQLVASIKQSPSAYYAGGLSSLSSMLTTDLDESAVWQLINQFSPENSHLNRQEEACFQARLLLKLAEIMTESDQEVDQTLHSVDARTNDLMATLRGEEQSSGRTITAPGNYTIQSGNPKLIKAWSHLFLAELMNRIKTNDPTTHWLLSSSNEDFEYLCDHTSNVINESPQKLCSLKVPDNSSINILADEVYTEQRKLIKEKANISKSFGAALKKAAKTGQAFQLQQFDQELENWAQETTSLFSDSHSSAVLEFYLLPVSLPDAFSRITQTSLHDGAADRYPAHGVVAVIKQSNS